MKKIPLFIALHLLLLFLINSPCRSAPTPGIMVTTKSGASLSLYRDYYALVIGISDYEKWPDLPNAVNDAQEVSEALRALGFTVNLLKNPDSQEFRKALNEFTYSYGREENRALLYYYAGHGETETLADGTKLGYIIPRDCPLIHDDPQGFVERAVSMKDIEAHSLRIRSKHVLMLFDSCFSGSLFSLVRAVPEDITEKSSLPVRQYITAGREDEQVPDKSMFKRCFLIGLEGDADLTGDGYITGSELGMYLSDKVVNYTQRAQHPQYGKINNPNLDRGDFVFVALSLEAKLKEAQDRIRKEIAEKEALQQELNMLKAEMEKLSHVTKESQAEQAKEKRLASITKKEKNAIAPKVTLRDIPNELWESDIKKMITKHNFFIKGMNEEGAFPNDFVDNGDGTITDRATGLMWQKEGSSSELPYYKAEKYVVQLNETEAFGYTNWRIPTIEELCSLTERNQNQRRQHISSLFHEKQVTCWSTDLFEGHPASELCKYHSIISFTKGEILEAATQFCVGRIMGNCFIRAVRTLW